MISVSLDLSFALKCICICASVNVSFVAIALWLAFDGCPAPALIFLSLFFFSPPPNLQSSIVNFQSVFRRGRPLIGGINKESNEVWKAGNREIGKAIPSRRSRPPPSRQPSGRHMPLGRHMRGCHKHKYTFLCSRLPADRVPRAAKKKKKEKRPTHPENKKSIAKKKKGQRMWQRLVVSGRKV